MSADAVSTLAQNTEYTTETREELLYNKEKLLGEHTFWASSLTPVLRLTVFDIIANGDRMEAEIAANLRADHGELGWYHTTLRRRSRPLVLFYSVPLNVITE